MCLKGALGVITILDESGRHCNIGWCAQITIRVQLSNSSFWPQTIFEFISHRRIRALQLFNIIVSLCAVVMGDVLQIAAGATSLAH